MKNKILVKIALLLIFSIFLVACDQNDLIGNDHGENGYHQESLSDNPDEFVYTFISYDVHIRESTEELLDLATHLIRGRVLDQRSVWYNPTLTPEATTQLLSELGLTEDEIKTELENLTFEQEDELITISRIEVLEVFQGDHQVGDIIEVMQGGGEYGNERWIVEDRLDMELGSELILFLVSWEFAGFPYSLTSHIQGAYLVPPAIEHEEYLVEIENLDIELNPLSDADPITITIEDLIEIAEENDLLD